MIQMWALQYWLHLDRRTQIDDKSAELELQCFNLDFDRWQRVYQARTAAGGDWGQAFDGEPELPITDPTDLDDWFSNLERQRGMSGAEVNDRLFGYADPGSGRRV